LLKTLKSNPNCRFVEAVDIVTVLAIWLRGSKGS